MILWDSLFTWITLFVLEAVLGLQNILVIDSLAINLRSHLQLKLRYFALFIAMAMRFALLCLFGWMNNMSQSLIQIGMWIPTGRDLLCLVGGLFLLYRFLQFLIWSKNDINNETRPPQFFFTVLISTCIANLFFSLDSVVAASALTFDLVLAASAIGSSLILMLILAEPLANWLQKFAEIRTIAHAFVALLGAALFSQGLHLIDNLHWLFPLLIFSVGVEILNIRRRQQEQVRNNWRDLE